MLNKVVSNLSLFGLSIATLAGCGQSDWAKSPFGGKSHDAMISAVDAKSESLPEALDEANIERFHAADQRSTDAQATPASASVTGTVTFRKDRIFNREFLYGFDLQYSSGADAQYDLIPQSEALGHVPCFFRRFGDELQLVADQSRLYESVVNHPELLLATYTVTAEDDQTLTVKFAEGGLVLNEVYNGKGTDAPKQVWVRSLNFVEDGEYLMQETALLLKNGTVQTFMESVFPRANLVPADYSGLESDAQFEPLADRYRFLSGERVYTPKDKNGDTVRLQTGYASRFALGDKGTIDWYTTPNAPDKFMPVLKSGVEGWNRYFTPQLNRNVMRFLGRLPDGVKLGDPRYNVINFDSVAEAGAAYESQAIDPMSGIQSHSLIYMPYAWYNIGIALWKTRTDTHQPSAKELSQLLSPKSPEVIFGRQRQVMSCMRSAEDVSVSADALAAAIGEGNVSVPHSLDEFGKRLMMSTLFHEVGHSLGLDHNFKGSLAFDGTKPAGETNPTSWSVMDYNFYQNEMDLFQDIGGSNGPALEYDRQIISQLYNHGADVKAEDLVVPACNDAEADNTDGGLDPLCVRYDAENNPSLSVEHSFHNLVAASGATGIEAKTLAEMVTDLTAEFMAKIASPTDVPTVDVLNQTTTDLGTKVGTLAGYFIASGAQSVRVNIRNNANGALRAWANGVEVDEAVFRGRYVDVLKQAIALRALPDAPAAAVQALTEAIKAAAISNTALGNTDADRTVNAAKAADLFNAAITAKVKASLSRIRQDLSNNLTFDLASPFALSMSPAGDLSHFEDLAVETLVTSTLNGLNSGSADLAGFATERSLAATALLTFKGTSPAVDTTIASLQATVADGLAHGDQKLVSAARALLKILNG